MLSASLWIVLFFIVLVATMTLRAQVRENPKVRAWYEQIMKNRLNLLKKVVVYGTLILWIGIWAATRGDDKDSLGSLLQKISNSWTKQEEQTVPTIKEE